MPHRWEDVRITIVRPGRVDQRGPCANSIPQDDLKAFSLPSGRLFSQSKIFTYTVGYEKRNRSNYNVCILQGSVATVLR